MSHRIRLRNGIEVINGITGETAPTYGEYVLAEDYDAVLDALNVMLGHMTGGMDGDWRDCDPVALARAAIAKAGTV